MKIKVLIPFRDRGLDPRRSANLEIVMAWWYTHGFEAEIVDDGLEGDAQFNRHRAYNRGVSRNPEAEMFVFTEADMLIHPDQIWLAARLADRKPGLVVPFTRYQYLSDVDTERLRGFYHDLPTDVTAEIWEQPAHSPTSLFSWEPESTMDDGKSIGAVNVMSRRTLDATGGFTEATSGNWYDDNIIAEGFAYLTGSKTQWVPGPALHLYHLPGHVGDHLTDADRLATERNKNLLIQMRTNIRMRNTKAVRRLMEVRS